MIVGEIRDNLLIEFAEIKRILKSGVYYREI
jgi:hypothetical protein